MAVLIDTSFLLAALLTKDAHHVQARKARQTLKDKQIIPVTVLQEVFQLLVVRLSYRQAIQAYDTFRSSAFVIEWLTDADLARMSEIMEQYADAQLDFTDTSIMALSERLNITQVYTFDRRDFSLFRPRHTNHLQLLP